MSFNLSFPSSDKKLFEWSNVQYLTTGIMRSATKEDIGLFKCMHGEEMMQKCRELSAKVSQPFFFFVRSCIVTGCVCVGTSHPPERKAD